MTFEIKRQSTSILWIHDSPEHSGNIFFLGLLLVFALFCLLVGVILSIIGLFIVISFIAGIIMILRERDLRCFVNRKTGIITHIKGGILGSQYDIQNVQCRVTEIVALEMVRYVSRGGDTFQIRFALVGNRTLPLSSAYLNFHLCQSSVSEIHQFIGVDIPLKTIDKTFLSTIVFGS
jgi:hypothetical protein